MIIMVSENSAQKTQITEHVNFISRVLHYSKKNQKIQKRTMDLGALSGLKLRKVSAKSNQRKKWTAAE